jgi:MurNAc alpha-1-phosphate uridylyltransferase
VQAVILAGGLATRMRPKTLSVAKSLLQVAGRPFILWQLEKIARSGFERVLLCIGHRGQSIRECVGDGRAYGVEVDYSDDGPRLLGTAGALRNALALLDSAFLVTYGDSYLPFDYSSPLRDLETHLDALGTMAVLFNRDRWDASNTAVRGQKVVRYHKGNPEPALDHIDYGALALRRTVVAALPAQVPLGLEAVQSDLARRGLLRALPVRDRFFEIGSDRGLSDLEQLLKGKA